ncbi:hypothetical protein HK101_008972, partial [Irineochytrium annulatum]
MSRAGSSSIKVRSSLSSPHPKIFKISNTGIKNTAEAYETTINEAKARRAAVKDRLALPRKLNTCRERVRSVKSRAATLASQVASLRAALDHLESLEAAEEGAAFQALLRDKPILKETLDMYGEFKSANNDTAATAVENEPEDDEVVPDIQLSEADVAAGSG